MTKKSLLFGVIAIVIAVGIYKVKVQVEQKMLAESKSEFDQKDKAMADLKTIQQDLVNQMKAVSGEGVCEEDLDCRVANLGVFSCGGYSDYLVYSVKDANPEILNGLVQKFNSNEEKLTNLSMKAAPCGHAIPRSRCEEKRCRIVP